MDEFNNFFDLHKFEYLSQPHIKKGTISPSAYNVDNISDDINNNVKRIIFEHNKNETSSPPENWTIPAGYTYLGQFISHDITLGLRAENQPPNLQLSGLYMGGPKISPFLYEYGLTEDQSKYNGLKFALETTNISSDNKSSSASLKFDDIPRRFIKNECNNIIKGLPLIGDSRNDQNFINSQLHILFLKAHNRYIEDQLSNPSFDLARKKLTDQYHYLILKDYLPKLIGQETVDDLKELNPNEFIFTEMLRNSPILPIFHNALMRVGHSQVMDNYKLHNQLRIFPLFSQENNGPDLSGFKRLSTRTIDWSLFFQAPNDTNPPENPSQSIDLSFAKSLLNHKHPYKNQSTPIIDRDMSGTSKKGSVVNFVEILNLVKKNHAFQDKILNKNTPQLSIDNPEEDGYLEEVYRKICQLDLTQIPPWVYFLCEARIFQNGLKLGPLGARILFEQLVYLLGKGAKTYDELTEHIESRHMDLFDNFYDFAAFADESNFKTL